MVPSSFTPTSASSSADLRRPPFDQLTDLVPGFTQFTRGTLLFLRFCASVVQLSSLQE